MIYIQKYEKCKVVGNKINITEEGFIHRYKETVNTSCDKKKEVGSVLQQMLLVLGVMKNDLKYRRDCS